MTELGAGLPTHETGETLKAHPAMESIQLKLLARATLDERVYESQPTDIVVTPDQAKAMVENPSLPLQDLNTASRTESAEEWAKRGVEYDQAYKDWSVNIQRHANAQADRQAFLLKFLEKDVSAGSAQITQAEISQIYTQCVGDQAQMDSFNKRILEMCSDGGQISNAKFLENREQIAWLARQLYGVNTMGVFMTEGLDALTKAHDTTTREKLIEDLQPKDKKTPSKLNTPRAEDEVPKIDEFRRLLGLGRSMAAEITAAKGATKAKDDGAIVDEVITPTDQKIDFDEPGHNAQESEDDVGIIIKDKDRIPSEEIPVVTIDQPETPLSDSTKPTAPEITPVDQQRINELTAKIERIEANMASTRQQGINRPEIRSATQIQNKEVAQLKRERDGLQFPGTSETDRDSDRRNRASAEKPKLVQQMKEDLDDEGSEPVVKQTQPRTFKIADLDIPAAWVRPSKQPPAGVASALAEAAANLNAPAIAPVKEHSNPPSLFGRLTFWIPRRTSAQPTRKTPASPADVSQTEQPQDKIIRKLYEIRAPLTPDKFLNKESYDTQAAQAVYRSFAEALKATSFVPLPEVTAQQIADDLNSYVTDETAPIIGIIAPDVITHLSDLKNMPSDESSLSTEIKTSILPAVKIVAENNPVSDLALIKTAQLLEMIGWQTISKSTTMTGEIQTALIIMNRLF